MRLRGAGGLNIYESFGRLYEDHQQAIEFSSQTLGLVERLIKGEVPLETVRLSHNQQGQIVGWDLAPPEQQTNSPEREMSNGSAT